MFCAPKLTVVSVTVVVSLATGLCFALVLAAVSCLTAVVAAAALCLFSLRRWR